jgi:hypothetical protein
MGETKKSNDGFKLKKSVVVHVRDDVVTAYVADKCAGIDVYSTELLESIGRDIQRYFTHMDVTNTTTDPMWATFVSGTNEHSVNILVHPNVHIHRGKGNSQVIIFAVIPGWRHCTAFVALHTSHSVSRIVVYFANVSMHSRGGSDCHHIFQQNDGSFTEWIKSAVNAFKTSLVSANANIVRYQEILKAFFGPNRYRIGIDTMSPANTVRFYCK